MKVKLIKVETHVDHISYNYGDDYSDVCRHIVSEETPWEEVQDEKLYYLEDFVSKLNVSKALKGYYALIKEEQKYSATMALEDMLEKARKEQLKRNKEEEERRLKEKARKDANALKTKARLEKQLAAIQERLKGE